jgi:hypothetical protein
MDGDLTPTPQTERVQKSPTALENDLSEVQTPHTITLPTSLQCKSSSNHPSCRSSGYSIAAWSAESLEPIPVVADRFFNASIIAEPLKMNTFSRL